MTLTAPDRPLPARQHWVQSRERTPMTVCLIVVGSWWPWPPLCARPGHPVDSRCCRPSPRSASGPRVTRTGRRPPGSCSAPSWGADLGGPWPSWPWVRRPPALTGGDRGHRLWGGSGGRRLRRRHRRDETSDPPPAGQRAVARPVPPLGLRIGLRLADRLRSVHLHHDGGGVPHGAPRAPSPPFRSSLWRSAPDSDLCGGSPC